MGTESRFEIPQRPENSGDLPSFLRRKKQRCFRFIPPEVTPEKSFLFLMTKRNNAKWVYFTNQTNYFSSRIKEISEREQR